MTHNVTIYEYIKPTKIAVCKHKLLSKLHFLRKKKLLWKLEKKKKKKRQAINSDKRFTINIYLTIHKSCVHLSDLKITIHKICICQIRKLFL